MTRKRIALEHPIEGIVDLIRRNFPRDEGAIGKIGREQSLPDAANSACAQHRRDMGRHNIDIDARTPRNFLERLADEAFDFVLRNLENLCVNWIVVLNRQHSD